MLQLYVDKDFFSPYAMAAFLALTEKGLPFELFAVDLARGEQHAAGFSQPSLTSRVPLLVDGDFTLSESSAIIEYLEDAYPGTPRVLPVGVKKKARARQLQAWLRSDLLPLRNERSTEIVFARRPDAPLSADARRAADKLLAIAEAVIPLDGGNLFDDWTVVDAELALLLKRLQYDALPPRLVAWAEAQWQRDSLQAWRAKQA